MIYRIRQIDVWSVTKITFIMFLFAGIIVGLLYLLAMGILANVLANFGNTEFAEDFFQFSGSMSVMAILILSTLNAVFWSVLVGFLIVIYNMLGGIKMVIEPETIISSSIAPSPSSNVSVPPSFEGHPAP